MMITNKTKGTIIAESVFTADTPFKRMQGLLGKKTFSSGQALVIRPCNSIHTFFMRFPIDVLFVDKDKKIVQAVSCLKPFRFSNICFKAKFVIELASGTIKTSLTEAGDILSF